MKTKFIYRITSVFMFLLISPAVMAQRDPGLDPDAPAAPIDDYVWVLVLVAVVFAIVTLKAYAKQTKPSVK